MLATCILFHRFATPCKWSDVEEFFRNHSSQLSEIFWETLEYFLEARYHLVFDPINKQFLEKRARLYADAVEKKSEVISNCIGFRDGTVIGIASRQGNMMQLVVYNVHKLMQALKYQAISTPGGLILHAYGPI